MKQSFGINIMLFGYNAM